MRPWLALVLSIPALQAHAAPPAQPRIAIAPTFAVLETTTEQMVPTQPLRSSSESDTTLGGTLSLGFSWRVRPWIDVGFSGHVARFVPIDDSSLSSLAIGPHVELGFKRFYFRGDVGIGRISDNGFGSGGVRTGAEVGYSTPLGSRVTAQMGLGTSALVTWDAEAGDRSDNYRYRRVLLSAALNCSVIFTLDR